MFRVAAIFALAVSLAACDMFSTMINGAQYAKAVEAELEASTGLRPQVGFNWHNGTLVTVTVTFPKLYEAKSLRETAALVRRSVTSHFEQTPEDIHLAFSLGKTDLGRTAKFREVN